MDEYPPLKSYRVTLDTLNEQYVYEVDAQDEEFAEMHGRQLAANDGLTRDRVTWVKVEDLT